MMIESQNIQPATVIGPLGEPPALESAPPPDMRRWIIRRKVEVVAAGNDGLLTIDEVCDRYHLATEKVVPWQQAIERSGTPSLRLEHIQHYRRIYERDFSYGL